MNPGNCIVRVMGSSWDEKPTLLEALQLAQGYVDKLPHATSIYADVYDSHGYVTTIVG